MALEGKLHIERGVYGEDTRSTYGIRVRPATAMEARRLSSQPEWVFFLPYVPLSICPDLPDPAAEFAYARNVQMEVVAWDVDYELVPKLSTADRSTAKIFGILRPQGVEFLNFARGLVLQDAGSKLATRVVIDRVQIVEPTLSRASSRERLLATKLEIFVLGVQSASALFTLVPDEQLKHLRVVRQSQMGDPGLWKVMHQFWSGDRRVKL